MDSCTVTTVFNCSEHDVYLSQFGEQGNPDHQLSSSHGLSLDTVGNIPVVDSGNKVVKLFSNSGGPNSLSFPFHCFTSY